MFIEKETKKSITLYPKKSFFIFYIMTDLLHIKVHTSTIENTDDDVLNT